MAAEIVGVPSRMTMAIAPPTMTSSVTRSIMLRNFQIRRPSSTSYAVFIARPNAVA